ncbi:DUF452 family protein [Pasteurella bettyae]|uniref:PF04301 family protein n=1 Tax=Pasteurella bettyae CCUG 2042 TaxID=1095749 RepID=I3DH73_9PAST|nr:pimeloyl-ACP methyl esterase BioG family protein [Pasteurella bettyae]EIJ71066.1 PF04301 family protein [Pasteurella bettyae CCUG 2042]SUB22270.1 putative dithiobiotin synthase [Pasteurella bettyae]
MKTTFINQQGEHLILYFAGWGAPIELVSHLILPENHDLLICSDYRNLDFNVDLTHYQNMYLVAWSMGVWVAEQVIDFKLKSATAINGTSHPRHNQWGIPEVIFDGTLASLDADNYQKFVRRICGNRTNLQHYLAHPQRDFVEIKQELECLAKFLPSSKPSQFSWTKAIIGEQDRIFPVDNQLDFWQQKNVSIHLLEAPHYLFAQYQSWNELC